MTNNADAQIAREWAARFIKYADNAQIVDADELTAARHILATTTPPTMADVEWDDEVHAGLCAEHPHYGLVRMLEHDHNDDTILCLTRQLRCEWSEGYDLTPLPGTRVDLTPRREPEPEFTPEHPAVLTTEEDYRNAPEGTVVAEDEWKRFVLIDELWRFADSWTSDHDVMAGIRRRVLRWGWQA